MKKVLLSLAALTTALAGQAQVLDYGFETSQSATIDTTNWGAYPESSYNLQGAGALTGEYALGVTTTGTANRWERVIAFKNLQMEANKSYRVSLWAKGTGVINVALMQGDWNQDMPLVAGNGDSYTQQVYDATIADAAAYKRVSFVFWHPSEEVQNQFYADFHTDTEKAAGEFLRLAFTGEGQYSVDDILVEEASVQNITCNGTAICIDFGYATNGASLAAAAGGTAVLDNSCAKVTLNGEDAAIESVEIKSDGKLYIFLDSENYYIEDGSKVAVSFTNPGNLLYSGTVAPECWDNPNCAVYSFTDEAAYFDEELMATSVAYEEAELVSSDPADESFELDYDISEFSFTFNKLVWANDPENGKPEAVLTGNGINENLEVVAFEGCQYTLTFKRPEGAAALTKGTYSISVNNVANEKSVATTTPAVISFEVGKVTVSETTYTELLSVTFPEATDGNIPTGWRIFNEGELRLADGTTYYSGPRTFSWSNSTVSKAFMFRTTSEEGVGYCTYGEEDTCRLTIPAGPVELRAIIGGWDNGGFNVIVSIIDLDDSAVVASEKYLIANIVGNTRENQVFQVEKIRFTSDGGNYMYKVEVEQGGSGYRQAVCGGLQIYSYVETEGEKSEAEVIFADDFSTYTNNYSPAEGSGWIAYYGGAARAAGADFDFTGDRCKTGLGAKNLSCGYYENGAYGGNGSSTPTNYLIYGEDETVGALHLNNQKYQFSYYGVVWKESPRLLYFQMINADGEVAYQRVDTLTSNMEGSWTANVNADKVQFTYAPAAGDYKLKFWVDNEAIFGNIKIVAPGSLAVQYKNLLKDALATAKEELETAQADEAFAGATEDALAKAISDYTEPDFHTVAEYNNAIAELEQLTKAMQTRRGNVTTYASALQNLSDQVASCADTKYTGLDAYESGVALLNAYAEISSSALADDELSSAVSDINTTYSLLKNMMETGVTLLTQQLADLAALVATYDTAMVADEVVLAAGNALTDDQELAGYLKFYAAAGLYDFIANGYNFQIHDEEYNLDIADSIDVTCFLQNASFYNTSVTYDAAPENFPGWNITLNAGTMKSGWDKGWDAYAGSETNPVANGSIKNTWGSVDIDVNQSTIVPVGSFTYTLGACDRSNISWTNSANVYADGVDSTKTVAYYETSEKTDTVLVNLSTMGQYYSESTTTMTGISVPAEENLGNLKVGGRLITESAYGFIDNARLYMTGRNSSFDYAAAAKAMKEAAVAGIQQATRNEAPAAVSYFNLAGQRVNTAEGVCIKIERYADGFVTVKKVIVK